ncbi:MAG: 50S ribosomal protein L18 [uncultured bacterium]|nr:MAG: 50S ribosomal protein L18 [uncultured bacterium]
MTNNNEKLLRRKNRVRSKISGTNNRPRLSVFRSNTRLEVQLINDETSKTLLALTDDKSIKKTKTEKATDLGKIFAEKSIKAGYKSIVFDRRGNKYHGRIKAFADSARSSGLIF